MPIVSLLGGAMFANQVGDNSNLTILALHGWGRDNSDFHRMFDEFGALLVDLPGFGLSPVPAKASSSMELAHQVAPVAASLGPRKILVGHSYGGRIALRLAARELQPDLLVLVGTPLAKPSLTPPSFYYRVLRRMAGVGLIPAKWFETLRRKSGSADYRASSGVMRDQLVNIVNDDYAEDLKAISCRTVVIVGEFDSAASPESSCDASNTLAHGELIIVEGSAHLLDGNIRRCVVNVIKEHLSR